MKNLGLEQMLAELRRLNGDNAKFDSQSYSSPPTIVGNITVESLHLPEGYYPNPQGHITNKKNVPKGTAYETFGYNCDVRYFAQKALEKAKAEKKMNNPLFKPVFGTGKKRKSKDK